jgi:hypothetical protein
MSRISFVTLRILTLVAAVAVFAGHPTARAGDDAATVRAKKEFQRIQQEIARTGKLPGGQHY